MKRTEIERLLPAIIQRTVRTGSPLFALLEVMEQQHARSEEALANLDAYFDPYRTPDAFVQYLSGWLDLDRLFVELRDNSAAPPPFPSGTGRLRELIAAAAYLSKWRGTARGLLRFLETATGVQGFRIDEQVQGRDGTIRPFHIQVYAPAETAQYRPLMQRIIEQEKPAYVTYELVVVSEQPTPPAR